MNIREFLTKILPSQAFPDNDLAAALTASGLKDVEVPDTTLDKFNGYYMTIDRAKNDPEVAKAHKTKHWAYFADVVEKRIKPMIALMPEAIQTRYYDIAVDKVDGIYERLDVLKDGFSEVSTTGKSEDVKAAAEKFRKMEKELRDQITSEQAKAKKLEEDFAQKESGIKINYALRAKLVDQLPKLDPNLVKSQAQKDFIIDSTIHSLQAGYLLEFDKENPASINFLNKDRTGVFEGNTAVTLDKFIEKQLEPYVVKNNGGTPAAPKAANPATVVIDKSKPRTLQEMRVQEAQKAGALA